MARRPRTAGLWAFAAMAAAHGLLVLWLTTQASILKFRAESVLDRSAVVISLRSLPMAAAHAPPVVQPPPVAHPGPAPEFAPSGPETIDQREGASDDANLAQPVFLDWPHPLPTDVDWGRPAPPPQTLALTQGWADCRKKNEKADQAWAPAHDVKAPCLTR